MRRWTKVFIGTATVAAFGTAIKVINDRQHAGNLQWPEVFILHGGDGHSLHLLPTGKMLRIDIPRQILYVCRNGTLLQQGSNRTSDGFLLVRNGLTIWKGKPSDYILTATSNSTQIAMNSYTATVVVDTISGKETRYSHSWVVLSTDGYAVARLGNTKSFEVHLFRNGKEYGKAVSKIGPYSQLSGLDYDGENLVYCTRNGSVAYHAKDHYWQVKNPSGTLYSYSYAKLAGPNTCLLISNPRFKFGLLGGTALQLMSENYCRKIQIDYPRPIFSGEEANRMVNATDTVVWP